MAPAAPASLTSSPIDRTARSTAELDGRNTEDRTLALSGPRQRNAFSIHAPAVRIHRLVAELNPHGSEPVSDIPGSLFVPGSVSDVASVRSRSAPTPKSGVQPGPPGSIFALKMSETRLSSGRSTGSSPPSDTHRSSRRSRITSSPHRAVLDRAPIDLAQPGWRRRPASRHRSRRAAR